MDLMRWIDDRRDAIIETYKYLHTIPELGFKEYKTAAFLASELEAAGLAVERNVGGTGIVATLRGEGPGPAFALRSDMDALPIEEETGLAFASTHPGAMHACGHDGHAAMVLWSAKALAANGLKRGVCKFLFQPAEELWAGARAMLADGALAGIEEIVGIHLQTRTQLAFGEASPGVAHSAACALKVSLTGRAAHGSRPHLGVNAVEAAGLISHAVGLVHVDPQVAHSAKPTRLIVDPGTFNIIPDKAEMYFDLRSQTNGVMDVQLERVMRAITKCAEALGAEAEVEIVNRLPGAEFDARLLEETGQAITSVLGEVRPVLPVTGSEDFHVYAVEGGMRAAFVGLGTDAERNHCGTVVYNTDAMPQGVKILTALAAAKLC